MNKNKLIKSFMEKSSIKSDDMAVYLNITKGIMANIVRGSRKVHQEEWKRYLKANRIIKRRGKSYFENLCTKRAKYLFPIEIKIFGLINCWTEIKTAKIILKNKNFWDINKVILLREKYKKDFIKINIKDRNLFNLLGWILAEGHIPKSDRNIQIHQKDKEILNKIKKNISHITNNLSINKSKGASYLNIISAPLRFLYLDYFKVPPGNKTESIKIPREVMSTNQENKYTFLAGLEGDMHFSITKRKNDSFLRPSIGLSLKNKKFIYQYGILLKDFGIFSSSCEKKNRKDKMQVSVIGRIKSTTKYFYYVGPYLTSHINYLRLSSILSQRQVLNSVRLHKKECNNLKNLLIDARNKISNKSTKENYTLLSNMLKREYNLNVGERTIEAWLFKNTGIPLSFIVLSCKLTSIPPTKILPNWVNGLLYLHNYISKKELEKLRKIKFPIQYKSQVSKVLPSWLCSLDHSF